VSWLVMAWSLAKILASGVFLLPTLPSVAVAEPVLCCAALSLLTMLFASNHLLQPATPSSTTHHQRHSTAGVPASACQIRSSHCVDCLHTMQQHHACTSSPLALLTVVKVDPTCTAQMHTVLNTSIQVISAHDIVCLHTQFSACIHSSQQHSPTGKDDHNSQGWPQLSCLTLAEGSDPVAVNLHTRLSAPTLHPHCTHQRTHNHKQHQRHHTRPLVAPQGKDRAVHMHVRQTELFCCH
jgi:hypothetical protein